MLKKYGIKYYVTFSENKAAVVERFNRTLKTKMWKYFTHKNTYRYSTIDLKDHVLKGVFYENQLQSVYQMKYILYQKY